MAWAVGLGFVLLFASCPSLNYMPRKILGRLWQFLTMYIENGTLTGDLTQGGTRPEAPNKLAEERADSRYHLP